MTETWRYTGRNSWSAPTAIYSKGAVSVESSRSSSKGTLIHPDGALAQVEGSALWGLSLALHEGSEFVKGQVKDTNLDSYTPLRIDDVPDLDIEFIDSTDAPVGLGELVRRSSRPPSAMPMSSDRWSMTSTRARRRAIVPPESMSGSVRVPI